MNLKQERELILKALWAIKRDGPIDTSEALCYNVCRLLERWSPYPDDIDENYHLVDAFRRWPEWNGSTAFPVGNGGDDYWQRNRPMGARRVFWTGEYGSQRIRLLNFLIRYFEGMLA